MKIDLAHIIFCIGLLTCACKTNTVDTVNNKDSGDAGQIVAFVAVVTPPQFLYPVIPAMEGRVVKAFVKNGDTLKKGDIICTLENPGYLNIQKEFVQLKNKLGFLKEEFKRQGDLTVENYASIKKMQLAQSEYLAVLSACKAMETQLSAIGFNPELIFKKGPRKNAYLLAGENGVFLNENIYPGYYLEKNGSKNYILTKDTLFGRIEMNDVLLEELDDNNIFTLYLGDQVSGECLVSFKNQFEMNGKYYFAGRIHKNQNLKHGTIVKAILKK